MKLYSATTMSLLVTSLVAVDGAIKGSHRALEVVEDEKKAAKKKGKGKKSFYSRLLGPTIPPALFLGCFSEPGESPCGLFESVAAAYDMRDDWGAYDMNDDWGDYGEIRIAFDHTADGDNFASLKFEDGLVSQGENKQFQIRASNTKDFFYMFCCTTQYSEGGQGANSNASY